MRRLGRIGISVGALALVAAGLGPAAFAAGPPQMVKDINTSGSSDPRGPDRDGWQALFQRQGRRQGARAVRKRRHVGRNPAGHGHPAGSSWVTAGRTSRRWPAAVLHGERRRRGTRAGCPMERARVPKHSPTTILVRTTVGHHIGRPPSADCCTSSSIRQTVASSCGSRMARRRAQAASRSCPSAS